MAGANMKVTTKAEPPKTRKRLRKVWLDIPTLRFALMALRDDRDRDGQRSKENIAEWNAQYEAADKHLRDLIAAAEK